MRTPLFLLFLSLACAGLARNADPERLTPALEVALLAALAALILTLGAGLFRRRTPRLPGPKDHNAPHRPPHHAPHRPPHHAPRRWTARTRAARTRTAEGPHVVIDGSNVMHWLGEVPRLAPLREVVAALRTRGYQPGIVFDANAGYLLADRYLDDGHFARLLDLPGDRVLVVPRGEPADPTILAAARELGAKVVTNDRYRDWADDFPEVMRSGHLVRGGYHDGKLWLADAALALPEATASAA